MQRWLVFGAFVGASVWYSACGLDTKSREQANTVFMDAIAGSDTTGSGSGSGSGSGIGSGSGSGSGIGSGSGSGSGSGIGSGSGSGSGTGSGSGSGSNGSGSGSNGDDAGVGGHGGNNPFDDKTNFYTCASCSSGGDPTMGFVLAAGVAIVLRRRRRA
ncbi:MAG TPA: MYXO-CTERM sorting domain-containing protein [Kofleriaceae bacterium]|nr:MYXO-CTERM sorting domain-containing protein [Kofleriaceae bacterium]